MSMIARGNLEEGCFPNCCPWGDATAVAQSAVSRSCRRGTGLFPAGCSCTLHGCLVDQAVLSRCRPAAVARPAAALPVRALAQGEAPGGEPAVALLPSDHCQRELLHMGKIGKQENRPRCKRHGIHSLQGMLLPR